jgi:WhiB family redox-sensing transcriptional regulator
METTTRPERSILACVEPPGPQWRAEAACHGIDPDVFFPERGDVAGMRAAKAICAGCPVRAACLDYALENHEREGVWSGTAAKERRRIHHLHRSERTGGHRRDPVSAEAACMDPAVSLSTRRLKTATVSMHTVFPTTGKTVLPRPEKGIDEDGRDVSRNGGPTMDDESCGNRCVALIEDHHRWAVNIGDQQALKFDAVTCGHGLSQEDLAAEAMVGLVKAAKIYDPASGVPFQAYAIHRIRGRSPTPPDGPTPSPARREKRRGRQSHTRTQSRGPTDPPRRVRRRRPGFELLPSRPRRL